jgi:superfamily I DNA/RNA helicase
MIKEKNNTESTFTEEQKLFIEFNKKQSIILNAAAGSGKTRVCTERLNFLLRNGVDPSKIIFFSFTVGAVQELKNRIQNDNVKITTIHSFCQSNLAKFGKYKKAVTFYDFIVWYKEKFKPKINSHKEEKTTFYEEMANLYDNSEYISAEISAYKLQTFEGIKTKMPDYFIQYCTFLKESKGRDFSDMLIELRTLLKENKWLKLFKGQYDYVYVDEAQDVSIAMMDVLLMLNAKYYSLILDPNQSIFGYSGSNCNAVIDLLKKRRDCIEMNLSINFRSAKEIIEHSNNYSFLKAIPFWKDKEGYIDKTLLSFDNVMEILKKQNETVILARTNAALREIEKRLLINKIPFRYTNYFSQRELDEIKSEEIHTVNLKHKINSVLPSFNGDLKQLIEFIEKNKAETNRAKTIHKSKGEEYESVILFNCISPEIIKLNNIHLNDEERKYLSFINNNDEDFESKNVFYVGITRSIKNLYFSLIDTK